jgi:hypothetical protein
MMREEIPRRYAPRNDKVERECLTKKPAQAITAWTGK